MTTALLSVFLASQQVHAAGMTCDESMSLHGGSFDMPVSMEAIGSFGASPSTSTVFCREERGASALVLSGAAGLGSIEQKASSSPTEKPVQVQGVNVPEGLLQTSTPSVAAPTDAALSSAEKPVPSIHIGLESSGSDFAKGPVYRASYRHPLSTLLAITVRASYLVDRGEAGLKDLTHTLVSIAYEGNSEVQFQQPVAVPSWCASGMLDIGVARQMGGLSLTPRARAGLGLMGMNEYYAVYDEGREGEAEFPTALGSPSQKSRAVAPLELASEVWFPSGFGFSMTFGTVAYLDKTSQYDPEIEVDERQLYASPRLGVDFIMSLGGQP